MTIFAQQLNHIVAEYEDLRSLSRYDDASDVLSNIQVRDIQTRCLAAIERGAGRQSIYFQRATSIDQQRNSSIWEHLAEQIGIAKSLLSDIQNGYIKSLEELIHADMFADFLEMASYLVNSGYKDPAAVITGATLESHLRSLCAKHGLPTDNNGSPKKADALNADLAKFKSYSKIDQKSVTAWLGIRNDAAHGNYTAYNQDQVVLLISGVRDFIARNPA